LPSSPPHADDVARAFYARLFSTWPQARPLFSGTDFNEQRRKLMASVAAVVTVVDKPDVLAPALQSLGRRHGAIGIQPRHYHWVSTAMLATLSDRFGPRWTPEVAHTWDEALHAVSQSMIAAHGDVAAGQAVR
jgi:hemoglobin-like flavoprotein